ncbi:hypothetical protein BH23ACT9_BH23ACT9_14850 [soil metagenome]
MSTDASADGVISSHIDVQGRRLHVRERRGDKRPFLLVHGLASNARMWDPVAALLAAAGHRVVAVDLWGHGQSGPAADGFGHAAVTADLVRLCRRMDLDRPVLAGQSWGGNVVIHAAASHPSAWHAVAAVDGGWIRLGQRFPDIATAWQQMAPPALAGMRADDFRRRVAAMVAGWPEGAVEAVMGNVEELVDGTIRPRLAAGDHRAIVEALLVEDPAEAWPRITVPVLLLAVRTDLVPGVSTERAVAEARAAISDARVVWFEGHHDVHLQQPPAVADALLTLV